MTAPKLPLQVSSSRDQRVGCRPSAPLRVGLGRLRDVVAVLTLLLTIAVGALVFASAPASAQVVDQTGTRVAAINPAEPTSVEADGLLQPRSPPVSSPVFDDSALGCCVAPRGAGLADDAIAAADDAFAHGYRYDPRIRARGLQDPTGHNFPYSFDDVILRSTPIRQADGSLLYRAPGSIWGKDGFFEIAVNTDTGTIFHRTYVGG